MDNSRFKFRAWLKNLNAMINVYILDQTGRAGTGNHFEASKGYCTSTEQQFVFNIDDAVLMQFTGHLDSNDKEVYEYDVHRQEIEEDGGDRRFYYVCVWIKEWSIFAWLCITTGEYEQYLAKGADSLDESMFWTYTVDRAREITVCGNIFEQPKLLHL